MRTRSTLAAGLVALSLIAATPFGNPAEAARWSEPATRYRVVDVPGNDSLHLRSRPSAYARVLANIPFNERRLETTGGRRGQWIEIEYQDERGRTVTGWANGRYLAVDKRRDEVTYFVTGLRRWDELNIRARPHEGSRIKGVLRHDATDIRSGGSCHDGWCPVEASVGNSGWRRVSGYVKQDFIAVTRPYTPYLSQNEDAGHEVDDHADGEFGQGTGNGYGYVENPRPRWPFWRWQRHEEWRDDEGSQF